MPGSSRRSGATDPDAVVAAVGLRVAGLPLVDTSVDALVAMAELPARAG